MVFQCEHNDQLFKENVNHKFMSNFVKLSEVAEIIRGFNGGRESPTGKTVKFLRVSNLKDLITIDTDNLLVKKISTKNLQQRDSMKIKKNDILISLTGIIGKTSIAIKNLDCFANSNIAIIRPKYIRPEYLLVALNSKKFQQRLKKLARGVTIQHVPLPPFREFMEIPLLSVSEELKVVKKFNVLKNNISKIEMDLEKTKKDLENFEIK